MIDTSNFLRIFAAQFSTEHNSSAHQDEVHSFKVKIHDTRRQYQSEDIAGRTCDR
jgi:hypothetical protein